LLEVTYEGTNQVKQSKISMLVHEYELFLMHDNECISDMFTRFTTIVNSLKNLGKSYSNQELVRKILRCLPRSWTPKVTAIEEAKDLSTLPLEQLLGSLMTHETTMKNHENMDVKKKKTISLKASREESESDANWEDRDPSSSEEENDEEVTNITFMEIEEENEDEVNFKFDELQNAYENLFNEYENVCLKNKSLKK
ncbi:UBN2 domain-containing protein, partial [Cephalotus follicularis]